MKKLGSILIVDDNRSVLSALQLLLRPVFTRVVTLPSPVTLPSVLRQEAWQVLLLDMNFGAGVNNGGEGLYWLHEAKRLCPALPVVLFTAYADIDLAVRGIKEGAADFVVKPWDNQRLIDTLTAAARPAGKAPAKRQEPMMYWGESPAMQDLRRLVEKVAPTDANILITGENGTGKEMLAHELHALSGRRDTEMVTVDMGALTPSLFESELFGHVRGAFTDAHTDRPGKFEAAHHGTLFMDEIGNLPYPLQAKLLTALQRRSVTRVGSNTPIPVDIRLICATNRDLTRMVTLGEFREDLLYRINTIHLEIPPLRERPEDIVPLARLFATRFGRQYGRPDIRLTAPAEQKLRQYPWKGNIRELEHAIEKAVIISDGAGLTPQDFRLQPSPLPAEDSPAATTLEEMEIQMIRRTMDACAGNLSAVAAQLGISRQTLYNKMKKYGL